jgi:cyclic pyranopterin phosphate synthase
MSEELTHIDAQGRAGMVDVSHKKPMHRVAVAEARFVAAATTIDRIMDGDLPKGEALSVARIAGIQAAKCVDRTIPLCHTLPLSHVGVDFQRAAQDCIRIETSVTVVALTGVEMEALAAASAAALTLWDMTKAVDKDLSIEGLRLVSKTKTPVNG